MKIKMAESDQIPKVGEELTLYEIVREDMELKAVRVRTSSVKSVVKLEEGIYKTTTKNIIYYVGVIKES